MDKNAIHRELAASPERFDRLISMQQADPANESLRRQCVDAAVALGHFDVALRLAELALTTNPIDARALFDKATALIGQRDYRSALTALRGIEHAAAREPGVRMNIGLCYYCLGDFEQARVSLDECYRDGVRSAGLLRLLVSACHHLGRTEDALRITGENAGAGAGDAALAGVYALLYLDAEDAMQASKWARKALQLDPKSIDGRVTEATLLTARAQTGQAKRMFEGVLQDAPATGRAWIGLGTLALLARQLDDARRDLRRGIELMPQHVGSWHALAWTELTAGELSAADAAFTRALELDRNFAETHGGLAAIAAMRGEKERARHLIEIALRLDPRCLSAQVAEATLTMHAGSPARGRKIIADTVTTLLAQNDSALGKLLLKNTRH